MATAMWRMARAIGPRSSSRSPKVSTWGRGITSTCPGNTGRVSRMATTSSSSHTRWASPPATMAQNTQSDTADDCATVPGCPTSIPRGLPETVLPRPSAVLDGLAAAGTDRAAVAAVVADYPRSLTGWAALGDLARRRPRGLRLLPGRVPPGPGCAPGQRVAGLGLCAVAARVNRGFLRSLDGLARVAAAIGERTRRPAAPSSSASSTRTSRQIRLAGRTTGWPRRGCRPPPTARSGRSRAAGTGPTRSGNTDRRHPVEVGVDARGRTCRTGAGSAWVGAADQRPARARRRVNTRLVGAEAGPQMGAVGERLGVEVDRGGLEATRVRPEPRRVEGGDVAATLLRGVEFGGQSRRRRCPDG